MGATSHLNGEKIHSNVYVWASLKNNEKSLDSRDHIYTAVDGQRKKMIHIKNTGLPQLYNRICRVFLYMASRKEYKNSFVFLGLACFDISYPLHALLFTIGFYTAMFLQHSEVYIGLKIGKSSLGNILVGPVIFHVAPNKLSSCNCRHEGELPCKNRTCDNGGQQPCVCSRRFFVCTLHPKQVQTSWLRCKLGATSNCANLNSNTIVRN